ncbi:MAG TPA: type I restriction endonuclease subunit R [Chloroflexota bacterium]|nr:type I restriction endonuclease subunit R [Chloroflexota bacterium]
MTADTTERGLEDTIFKAMTGYTAAAEAAARMTRESPIPYLGTGWLPGRSADYDRAYCLDLVQLTAFLEQTQPDAAEALSLHADTPTRRAFLARLQGEIAKRGTINVLRNGIKHGPHQIELFYGTPSAGNALAAALYSANRFSVTRQLQYSQDQTRRALDLGLFVNGLPVATAELKNSLTKQTVTDAIEQYQTDRDPREPLFAFGRCVVHLAVDDSEVWMCTELRGKASWFLPLNKGWNDGSGNPPNPDGLKTAYLWEELLTPRSLTDILEHYAQIVEEKDERTGRKRRVQIFPRYHQLDVVRKLLADAGENGAGRHYLIQHSAGSGKSNSIAWLASGLVGLRDASATGGPHPLTPSPAAAGEGEEDEDGRREDEDSLSSLSPLSHRNGRGAGGEGHTLFDSVIVVTDRRLLDKQIRDTIRGFVQVSSTVGHAEHSGQLRQFLQDGKRIVISTVQKFPMILDDIGNEHRGRNFAIIIDEAHSSQGGKTSAALNRSLADQGEEDEETVEDAINRIMESRRLLPNASYFAFTATPKNKTLEMFGEKVDVGSQVHYVPFHSYTMRQAIEEGFILDVLANYTPVNSYYHLTKQIAEDPEFDTRRAQKRLRLFVEGNPRAIRQKAAIMVDHFLDQVIGQRKIGGEARAMVVTGSIRRALEYYGAIATELTERKSPYKAIVAFSGEVDFGGKLVTEAGVNGFPSNLIAERIREDPYRILVCADKFQTGYDEPLLHTMYVDKILSGIKAVQTLSRLNRAHPRKRDTFVLDFANDPAIIEKAFAPYYRTTILSGETDPNKLHDLQADLDAHGVYTSDQVDGLVQLYLSAAPRDQLDVILDACVEVYKTELAEDEQVDFKGKAKAFLRTYGFLSTILPYTYADWEKRSIFLTFLIPKLPAPKEEDTTASILEAIDMDSYRAERQATLKIRLPDEDGEIAPIPVGQQLGKVEPEYDRLSNIIRSFNDLFGNIAWTDRDRVENLITETIPQKVAADPSYTNARANSDAVNARVEHDQALNRVMMSILQDDTQLFKYFSDDPDFKRWLADRVFEMTYRDGGTAA